MKNKSMKRFSISPLSLALFASFPALAQIAPDAGQTSRELQRLPVPAVPKAAAPLRIEGGAAPAGAAADGTRFAVKSIHVADSSVFAAAELEALVADLAGGEHTLAELDAGAARITAWYRDHGYAVARAYLPAQDIKDGAVTIRVLEGRIGALRVTNQSRVSDAQVNDYLGATKGGEVLQAGPVDRALLLLGDTPGVGAARATLTPGASVGTADLVVDVDPAAPYTASVELDNYGNRYTGEHRLGGALALNSPLSLGDQVSLRVLASDLNLRYARLAYQVPVGASGLRLGVAYADTRYKLGKEFTALEGHGSAKSSSLFAVFPFVRSSEQNLSGTLTWEKKTLSDVTNVPVSVIDKRVDLLNFGLAGNRQDALGGGGTTMLDLSLVAGRLQMDAASLATDLTTAQSHGSFTRFTYTLSRLQRLTDTETLSLLFTGQEANKNLNSSEKFSLGGANGVRAFPQGEGSGDQGWMTNLELRHAYSANLQAIAFYDSGSVTINRNAFAAGVNSRSISGAGVGASAKLAGAQFKAYLAWRTGGGQPQSEPATVNRSPRLWLQVSLPF